jgi:hypothetical protein
MIKVQVFLQNDHDRTYDEVEITKEELLQYACNKAKERYMEGHWTKSSADEIKVEVNCA